jgi:peptide/nickel transport system permease protein
MSQQSESARAKFVEQVVDPLWDRYQYRLEKVRDTWRVIFANDMAKVGGVILLAFVVMALFAPAIAPHNPHERVTTEAGGWQKDLPPSLSYPLGTTGEAYPLFSRLVYGSRVAFLVGLLTAVIVAGVGTLVGMVAGYHGGYVEDALMRVVDTAYGLPFLPFVIVLIMILGRGYLSIILAISIILWRGTARVIRSEVVSIKEQPMIDAAVASGASDLRIIFHHILPKVLPITMLYAVFAIGWAIIAEAGLSFIGFGDASKISWGLILNNAHTGNALLQGMWIWIVAPGLCIVLFVLSTYFISQGIEEVVNPQLRSAER